MEKNLWSQKVPFFKIVLKILLLTQMKASFMGEGGGGGWVLTVPQIPLFIREVLFFVSGFFFRGGLGRSNVHSFWQMFRISNIKILSWVKLIIQMLQNIENSLASYLKYKRKHFRLERLEQVLNGPYTFIDITYINNLKTIFF